MVDPHAFRRRSSLLLSLASCALLLPACAGTVEPQPDPSEAQSDASRPSGLAVDGAAAPALRGDGGSSSSPDVGDKTVAVAVGCATPAALPKEYVSQCTGCHGTSSAYPDLHAYSGSESMFVAKVRAGGSEMPAFASATIDDVSLHAVFVALTAHASAASTQTSTSITPLFASSAAGLPISFKRDDGVLITRAAGRVRQRHELEGSYGPFGPHYFQDRTYGFIVEDFTVKGESRVRVSYLPIARPEDKTNFRAWKVYGDGNVFHSNMGMTSDVSLPSLKSAGVEQSSEYAARVAPYARIQAQEVTTNPRANRKLAAGDILEFEFGIFIDVSALTTPGSRNSYYTDTFRYRVGQGGLSPDNDDSSGKLGPTLAAQLGGDLTIPFVNAEPETYLEQLALNVQHEHVQSFVEGRRLFHTDFGDGKHSEPGNPVFSEQAGKLGPLSVARACVSCHEGNGGGHALSGKLSEGSSMVFKLYDSQALGNQLQLSEGSAASAAPESSSVTLGDGSKVALSKPTFALATSEPALAYSARIARRLVGLGLLEAVDEQTLLARADADDCDGDGISGRPSLVRDPAGVLRLGRFGWKAEKVSVEHQVADALDADLGVQTHMLPGASGVAELSDADLAKLTTYMRLLGVPPQQNAEDAQVQRGGALFRSVGCANCHAPELSTGAHPFVELRGQKIQPYSDLLLHDLGPALADRSGMSESRAAASEWRTAPLWGIAAAKAAQGVTSLLHDGRAASVLEAVLWHDGEAAHIRERFTALPAADRDALVHFVESL